MGWFGSEEQVSESKTVDSVGHVNTNIVIQEAADTHSSMIISEKLLFATYLLVGAEILKLGLYATQSIRRYFKKRYQK